MGNAISNYLATRFPLVEPLDFYRDLFPIGELDIRGAMTKGKYCAIAVQVGKDGRARRYTVCDDLEPIGSLIRTDDFTIISPVSYAGKTQSQTYARYLYAIVFDLDNLVVSPDGNQAGIQDLIHQATSGVLPLPTYIVSSGNGVHCYYFLDKPFPLYQSHLKKLRAFRTALTKKLWNKYTTKDWNNPQFESCTQGFRIPGSICKDGVNRVQAFKAGDRVSIEYLNTFVPKKSRSEDLGYESKLTLEQAKEKYGDWYERRIVQGQPKGTWTVKRDLYDWWKRQIESGATVGHRYFCIMALAIYARKCGISRDELEKDAIDLIPFLDAQTVQEDNHFDIGDVMKALEAYKASYITFPRASIEELTAIDIPANKRNGRTLEAHNRYRAGLHKLKKALGEIENDGRPSKRKEVWEFADAHPDYNISQIARETGMDWNTVAKHLKSRNNK